MSDAIRRARSPKITLTVTQEMIEKGIRADSEHCIWAEALRAARPDARSIAVDLQTIRFTDPVRGLRYSYLTPRAAQVSLVEFDQGIMPEPASCTLRGAHVSAAGAHNKKGVQSLQRKTVVPDSGSKSRGNAPLPYGGKPPPIGALATGKIGNRVEYTGRRRAFGIRGLGRVSQVSELDPR